MSASKPLYRRDIDGLRAFAVTAVVLFHAGLPLLPSGFVGVDVFFVISGYLIGGIIFREVRQGTFTFANFYARRARRILPALICVISASCVAGLALLDKAELTDLASSSSAALLGISNIKFLLHTDYFDTDSLLLPMLMTWSLGVEEQFYLLFPFLLMAMARRGIARTRHVLLLLSAVSFGFGVIITKSNPPAAFYLLPLRAWELGLGVLLAIHHEGDSRSPGNVTTANLQGGLGLALLLLSVTIFDERTPFPGFAATLPVCGTLLLLHAHASWVNRQVLAARPMVFIGLVSYSWYLWHWPLMAFARIVFARVPPLNLMLAIAATSFVLAFFSWRWVEQPFRVIRHGARVTLLRYGSVLMLALAFTVGLKLSHGLPSRLPASVARVENMIALGRGSCLAPFGATQPDTDRECLPPNDGTPAIALLGDSHASALGPGLKDVAGEHRMRLLQFTKSACTPLLDVALVIEDRPSHALECVTFMRNAIERIENDPSITLVIVAATWPRQDWGNYLVSNVPNVTRQINALTILQEGLLPLLKRFTDAGKRVTLVGDVPAFTFDPSRQAVTEALPIRRWIVDAVYPASGIHDGTASLTNVTAKDKQTDAFIRQAATMQYITFTDLYANFCTPQGCRYMQNGDLLFIDHYHLSTKGSRSLHWELPL